MKNILWLTTILASFALLLSFQTKVELAFVDYSKAIFSTAGQNQPAQIATIQPNSNLDLPECVEIETEEVKEGKAKQRHSAYISTLKGNSLYFYPNCLPDNFIQFNPNQCQSYLAQGLYLLFHSLVFYE